MTSKHEFRAMTENGGRFAQAVTLAIVLSAAQAHAQSASDASGLGAHGFSISVDGETISGTPTFTGQQRTADLAAARAGVDIRYDGLDTRRMLNVTTDDLGQVYRTGDRVTFRTSTNYPGYVARGELRIIDLDKRGQPTVATVPTTPNGQAEWVMPANGSGHFAYVLRVYDDAGRFDETTPRAISRTDRAFDPQNLVGAVAVAPGEGDDNTARRGIPVNGGLVTVSGGGAAPGGRVMVMGEPIRADGAGRFVVSRILPPGDHVVAVEVGGRRIVRDVNIPRAEWFRTGLIDVTVGGQINGATGGRDFYADGRIGFYLKGATAGGYRVTGSVDTGNGPIDEIFSRLNDKDPRRVLDRLRADTNPLYSTYGDDSSFYDDTPTAGRVYLQVENDTTRLTWGDFKAGVAGAGLLQNTRDLYGAELRYQSRATTNQGNPRLAAVGYAASPDTISQKDVLLGTGGSVYFLSHQDITSGSAALSVQVVDRDTGRIISTQALAAGADYTIDHIQGLVMLNKPLSSGAGGGGLVSNGGPTYDMRLIAQYEYTPNGTTVNDLSLGGRVEAWVTDQLRFGVTGMREKVSGSSQDMLGADLRFQLGETSYAELEYARTSGPGFSRANTTDGGLTIVSSTGAGSSGAGALRFDGQIGLRDIGIDRDGFIGAYVERKEAGFSTLSEDIVTDQTLYGAEFEVAATPRLTFSGRAEHFAKTGGDRSDEAELGAAYAVNDIWSIDAGLAYIDQTTAGVPSRTGQRVDGALKVTHRRSDDLELYAFGQGTINRQGTIARNDRAGVGLDARLNQKLGLAAELSGGTGGAGGNLRLSYAPNAASDVYLGYTLDPTRGDAADPLNDKGRIVAGGRTRASEKVTLFSEVAYDLPGTQRSLSRIFGVNYTPTSAWTLGSTVEIGTVRDAVSGDFDRIALSFGAAYAKSDDLSWRARVEYRNEDGAGTARDRDTVALSAGFSNKVNADWRLMGSLDALVSDSALGGFEDGEYVRASLGYAYRPVENEKLNLLLSYSYLRDLPGTDQVGADGTTNQPLQVGNIFSVNASYDLSPKLTFGGKLGYRSSSIAPRGTTNFTRNTATLAAMRLDYHLTNQWDIMGEGRALFTRESDTTELGAVAAAYRHLNSDVKIGLGYEWGSVSDDLSSINYQNEGLFLNLVKKF